MAEDKKEKFACLVCNPDKWFIQPEQFVKHCKTEHNLNPRKYW